MPKINPNAPKEIDAYINALPPFSKAICNKLREIIHTADCEILEDWKWGPNFNKNGMICGFGAFKQHATFVFFRGSEMKDENKLFNHGHLNNSSRSIKFESVDQINSKILLKYVKQAVKISLQPKTSLAKEILIPDEVLQLLKANKRAKAAFENLNYTGKKEYIVWLSGAKRQDTKEKRQKLFIEFLLQGKIEP